MCASRIIAQDPDESFAPALENPEGLRLRRTNDETKPSNATTTTSNNAASTLHQQQETAHLAADAQALRRDKQKE